jgi:ABC-type transport system involved in multi-copper enzyme maturation permease subunit
MGTLLEIELRKLVPSRDFWFSVSAYVILVPAVFLSLALFNVRLPSSQVGLNLYDFPEVWHNLAYIAQWVNVLLCVTVLQIVTNEYQLRTIRQNIIDGLSPWQYLWGKVMLLVVFTVASTALLAACALLAGRFMSESHDLNQMFAKSEYIGLYCLQSFGYLTLALLVGTLVRKTGLAVVCFIGYTLIVEPILRGRLVPAVVGLNLPSYVLGRLVPNPFAGYLGMGAPAPVHPGTIVLSCAYVIAFVLISGWLIASRDL